MMLGPGDQRKASWFHESKLIDHIPELSRQVKEAKGLLRFCPGSDFGFLRRTSLCFGSSLSSLSEDESRVASVWRTTYSSIRRVITIIFGLLFDIKNLAVQFGKVIIVFQVRHLISLSFADADGWDDDGGGSG